MADIASLIDRRIDETFILRAPKSYTSKSASRKPKTSSEPPQTSIPKSVLTPKKNLKEEKSLLIRAARTRGESHENYNSDISTSVAATGKLVGDPWKSHKRVALLQHPLWVECLKSWWNVMDPHEISNSDLGTEGKITKEQYLDLNVRLQKSLNPEFEYENACTSAVEDWEIDAEDWEGTVSIGETQHPGTPNSNYSKSVVSEHLRPKNFGFDKFSEFLFETGEVWSDGSIEGILLVINSALLNISHGVHMSSTVFKDIDHINMLPNSLFQEISEIALNSAPKNLEFMKWYQRNFLDLENLRIFITNKLFRIMPDEARINDLWINQQGYNQTDILIQCTNRLEGLLNRIQKSQNVRFPIKESSARPKKILENLTIQGGSFKKTKVPNLPLIRPQENEPLVTQNKIIFTRNINLALVGQSYTSRGKSQEVTENRKNENSVNYNTSNEVKVPNVSQMKPSISQKIGTDLSPLDDDRDFLFDTLFQESKRPFSTPLHATKKITFTKSNSYLNLELKKGHKLFEENLDPEYTPKLKFNKTDVKYHNLQKSWRKGKFLKVKIENNSPEVGEINKKSPMEYYEHKKKQGMEKIKAYESIRQSRTQDYSRSNQYSPNRLENGEKKDSIESDDIERLVGIKISVNQPQKESTKVKATPNINENVTQTAPINTKRKRVNKNIGAVYSFEEFSHLIGSKNNQKLVFTDNLEFLYALNQAKYEFNTTHQSDFLKSYSKKFNEYRSRRDELGGHISNEDWKKFIANLEEIIKITKNRRKRRRLRRKRLGKKIGIHKGPNLNKNQLWKNVFIRPYNQEKLKRNKYLREANKIDSMHKEIIPPSLAQIVNESTKVPIPPSLPKTTKGKLKRYSPGRYRPVVPA